MVLNTAQLKQSSTIGAMKERAPGCLVYIGDENLPSCIGIKINQWTDPYQLTSKMESRRVPFVAQFKRLPYQAPFQLLNMIVL